jgi:hypothetical protein
MLRPVVVLAQPATMPLIGVLDAGDVARSMQIQSPSGQLIGRCPIVAPKLMPETVNG